MGVIGKKWVKLADSFIDEILKEQRVLSETDY